MVSSFQIALLPGDGIGGEVADAGVAVLDTLSKATPGLALVWRRLPGGAQHYLDTGNAFSD